MDSHAVALSVVMAVHNGEQYWIKQVDSILNQNIENFEMIVIDDASSDAYLGIQKNTGKLKSHQSGTLQNPTHYMLQF